MTIASLIYLTVELADWCEKVNIRYAQVSVKVITSKTTKIFLKRSLFDSVIIEYNWDRIIIEYSWNIVVKRGMLIMSNSTVSQQCFIKSSAVVALESVCM